MLEQYIISDIRQLKALSHSSRVRILSSLSERPMTAKQLADQFGEEPAKTSYHVKQLLKVGLVELVYTRETQNGIVEKYYRAIAKEFQTDPYLARQPEGRSQLESGFVRLLNKTHSDFLRAYRDDLERNAPPEEGGVLDGGSGPRTAYGFGGAAISQRDLQAFLAELKRLTEKYFAKPGGAGQPEYTFHYLLFPAAASPVEEKV